MAVNRNSGEVYVFSEGKARKMLAIKLAERQRVDAFSVTDDTLLCVLNDPSSSKQGVWVYSLEDNEGRALCKVSTDHDEFSCIEALGEEYILTGKTRVVLLDRTGEIISDVRVPKRYLMHKGIARINDDLCFVNGALIDFGRGEYIAHDIPCSSTTSIFCALYETVYGITRHNSLIHAQSNQFHCALREPDR
ncbi:MAG: hypothetical protein U5N86_07930 [Planctomycetota bacterium]|nr:hypothetical protein [Planctomycetota bacterium]